MKTNKRYVTALGGSVCAAAIITGAALAGNPHGTPPGQAKKQASVSASVSATASVSAGVKPSATTSASGHNTNALAASTKTKLYGNGKTAGQIAMQSGAGAATNLYGPGNSQPHKPVCPGGKATFDVHALKAHGTAPGCASASVSSGGSVSGSASASVSSSGNAGVGAKASGGGKGSQGAFTPPSTTRNGGTSSQGAVAGTAHAAHPVLGAANFTG
ncbi:MAG TPA: hypothetical protein VJ838_00680 [Gaiellaceae bacterium]|nr:hypothetical protein [Gaiellaceae bacterium]